ncbi:MAG TPA: hypothetical protein DCP54_09570, partial [Chryseobacterium sp.]|nr:hypothetical protein [Chryseobacterium sp.]
MKRYFFIVALILLCVFARGQVNTIKGSVSDTTGQPLELVTVSLIDNDNKKISTFSEADGTYIFENVPFGRYSLEANHIGFEQYRSGFYEISAVNRDTVLQLNIVMKSDAPIELDAVSVTGKKPLIEQKIDRVVMNVENSILAKGNSALDILQSAPGVGESKNGGFSLRGREGTMILINDKPTYLSAGDIAELLRNTPGHQVQSIELMTNPPAKFEAEGSGGIINIKMKNAKALGFNGTLNALAGYGKYYKWSTGVGMNFGTAKTNISVNLLTSGNKRFNDQTVERVNDRDGVITHFDQVADRVRRIGYNHFDVSMEYFLNNKNTFRVFTDGSFLTAKQTLYNETVISNNFGNVDSVYNAIAPLRSNYSDMRYGASYEYKVDTLGKTLTFDFSGGRFDAKEVTQYNNSYQLPEKNILRDPDTLRISSPNKIDIYAFKSDYSNIHLNNNNILDIGIKFTHVKSDNDFGHDSLRNGTFYSTIYSNRFIYKENVNAGYVNYNLKWNNTAIQAGLRVEQTRSEGISYGSDEKVKRHYTDFFPSFFIDHKLSESSKINLAYSRRIDRPSYEDLNPFMYLLDQFTFSQGNPFLKPQYSNSLELNYTLFDSYTASLGYQRVNQVMSEVVKTDPISKTLIFSYDNLAKEEVLSLALTAPIRVTNWWSSFVYYNGYWNRIVTPDFG